MASTELIEKGFKDIHYITEAWGIATRANC